MMDRKHIAEKLRKMAQKAEHRSKAAQLRDVIEDIDAAMAKGVSRKAIVNELAKNGLVMPLSTFDSILLRHRKKHGKSTLPGKKHPRSRPIPERPSLPEEEEPETPASSPVALDDIINSTPDLAQYARLAKTNKRKKP